MKKRAGSNRRIQLRWVLITMVAMMCIAQTDVVAQGTFKRGDKVMASPSSLKDDQFYRQCTVIQFDRSANAYHLDCDGTGYVVSATYVRAVKGTDAVEEEETVEKPVEEKPVAEKPNKPERGQTNKGQFKVGDRVLASLSGLKDDKYYRPCTVIRGLEHNSYGLRCDPQNGYPYEERAVKPQWIKPWENATAEPPLEECPFNKNYAKVDNNAPASAALFKSVIFELRQSLSNYYDFGLTFLDFKMGGSFKNVAIGGGRKRTDPAPLGATIYQIKTKELKCRKDLTITARDMEEIEYDCYKSAYGEWECKQGLARALEPPKKIRNQ